MPRPSIKQDLFADVNEQFDKLQRLIDSMTEKEHNAPFRFEDSIDAMEALWKRDQNLRDVLTHFYEWYILRRCPC